MNLKAVVYKLQYDLEHCNQVTWQKSSSVVNDNHIMALSIQTLPPPPPFVVCSWFLGPMVSWSVLNCFVAFQETT